MELNDNPTNRMYDAGEEKLNQLIKQAGEEARLRKEKSLLQGRRMR